MGASYGKAIVKDARSIFKESVPIVDYIINLAETAGWGKFSISGDKNSGKDISVTVTDCIFCCEGSVNGDQSCDFLVGVIHGILDELYERPHIVVANEHHHGEYNTCKIALKSSDS
jgi:predicted hydrocarbon binding protein